MSHDAVLFFSKTWGAIYLGIVFLLALAWTYWPSHKSELDAAAKIPLREEDKPCR